MPSDLAAATEFKPGEDLLWTRVEGEMKTKRNVRFVQRTGPDSAVVSFGVNGDGAPARYTARLDELARPAPPATHPWYLPNPVEAPRPPEPPSEAAIAGKLEQRRQVLRDAHAKAARAHEAREIAMSLADRGARACEAARAQLAAANIEAEEAASDFADAIREGREPQYGANGHDRGALRRAVEMAEQARSQFDRELADRNNKLGDALEEVRRAAAEVLATVIEREAETFRKDLGEIRRRYFKLHSATIFWPSSDGPLKLSQATANLLADPPRFDEAPSDLMSATNSRQQPLKSLLTELVNGNSDADI